MKKRTSQISKCDMLLRIVKETQRKSRMLEPQVPRTKAKSDYTNSICHNYALLLLP